MCMKWAEACMHPVGELTNNSDIYILLDRCQNIWWFICYVHRVFSLFLSLENYEVVKEVERYDYPVRSSIA